MVASGCRLGRDGIILAWLVFGPVVRVRCWNSTAVAANWMKDDGEIAHVACAFPKKVFRYVESKSDL